MRTENRFRWEVRPKALRDNTVQGSSYRFTVLTANLIRVEYDAKGYGSKLGFFEVPAGVYGNSLQYRLLLVEP